MPSVYLEITHQCNLHCPHCYNKSGNNGEEMDVNVLRGLVKDLVRLCGKNSSCNLALSGGEPLIRADIKEILREINEYHVVNLNIITNGTMLDKIESEFLNETSRIGVQISLDGISEETNDKIRGNGHYRRITHMVDRLYQRGFRKCALKMTINKLNYREIGEFIDFSLKHSYIPKFAFLIKEGNAVSNWDELELSTYNKIATINEIRKQLIWRENEIRQIDKNLNIESLVPSVVNSCPLLDEKNDLQVLIKPNGDVQPCQVLYDSFFSIGNINEKSIDDILDEKKNIRIRNLRSFLQAREKLLKDSK